MVAWIALAFAIVGILLWALFIIGVRSIVNRYRPAVAPYLAMFTTPAAAKPIVVVEDVMTYSCVKCGGELAHVTSDGATDQVLACTTFGCELQYLPVTEPQPA